MKSSEKWRVVNEMNGISKLETGHKTVKSSLSILMKNILVTFRI